MAPRTPVHPTVLVGARTHNLKGVSLTLTPGEVVVVTGVSGAGKSSLALDTLYAEGQRRYVESFSPYARQFLERLERPPVERLDPVAAGIAVDRRAPIKSSRSTLATMADLEPYLSALFASAAWPWCPEHEVPAEELDASGAARALSAADPGAKAVVTWSVPVTDREAWLDLREHLQRSGFGRVWHDGSARSLDEVKPSALVKAGEARVVIDRLSLGPDEVGRLTEALEVGWREGAGVATLSLPGREVALRRGLSCPRCARAFEPPRPALFSWESPLGACPTCRGFGRTIGVDLDKVIPDPRLTLGQRAIRPWNGPSTRWERAELAKLCARHSIPLDVPWGELTAAQRERVLEGDGPWGKQRFPGVKGWFSWLETRTYKMHVRVLLARYRSYDPCATCGGQRLAPSALAYRVGGLSLAAWHGLSVREARSRVAALQLAPAPVTGATAVGGALAGRQVLEELGTRLGYLDTVGLGHLTLDRPARTLSGGEAQRVTLTAALGTSLCNALFVLDEPSVGLHPTDVAPLADLCRQLAARGNTVVVVEHDPTLIQAADRVVELGPGAGEQGGRVTGDGSPAAVVAQGGATARALAGAPPAEGERRAPRAFLEVRGASAHNLRDLDVRLPLGVIGAITGPSGSGKSTLLVDVVHRALGRRLGMLDVEAPLAHRALVGAEAVEAVMLVDQGPLGRTSRGNAATYTGAWDAVRKAFAAEPAAQLRGLGPGAFSFNVAGGRCEACSGEGAETVEMQFLADVRLVCPVCQGRRFQDEVLAVRHRGHTVAEVLEQTVDATLELFRDVPALQRALGPVQRLGLGHLRLGQPLSTVSGGEAQRLKLARALGTNHRRALFILDEPSAGLHADEVRAVLHACRVIVLGGGSVLIIDHDLDLIAAADWIVDLGPGAGPEGGTLVAEGPPDVVEAGPGRTAEALRERRHERERWSEALREARRGGGEASRAAQAKGQGAAAKRGAVGRHRASTTQGTTHAASPVLSVQRASEHNLRDVSVEVPHGALTVVTGPSGSGKSTLAFDVIFAEGQRRFLETLTPYARQFLPTLPRPHVESVTGVPPSIALEQRTTRGGTRSTVATVTEVAHYLRLLWAKLGTPHCPEHGTPLGGVSAAALLDQLRALGGRGELLAPAVRARKGTHLDVFTTAARGGVTEALCDGARVSTDRPPKLARTKEHDVALVMEPPGELALLELAALERALTWGRGAVEVLRASGERTTFSTAAACSVCGFSVGELDPRWFSFATVQGKCAECDGVGTTTTERKVGRGKAARVETTTSACTACGGTRLAPIPRAVRLDGEGYAEFSRRSVASALARAGTLAFTGRQAAVAEAPLRELLRRLKFLVEVGLDYLSLDRAADTLSGGELQRLRLGAQLGAGLSGALYVLDEPTIGLHPRDTGRLLEGLRRLVALGSTVLVVEHDVDTIRAADHLIDLGPGGGVEGGRVMAAGAPSAVLSHPDSPTGRALAQAPARRAVRPVEEGGAWLTLRGAAAHNLRGVDLRLPLGRLVAIAGVSGSGKSTLVQRVLLPAVRQALGLVSEAPGPFTALEGVGPLKRALAVDQSPIGRTPRSVPATFLGVWDAIRRVYAATPEARAAGFGPARFSFNTARGGRCATCEGQGVVTHEMSFLPDVSTPCPACEGQRFEPRTLGIRYHGLTAGETLALSVEEAARHFAAHREIAPPLLTLTELGAGYVRLGQGSPTLSGGEAQRLKLSAELTAGARHEPTLYVLDEPTTGLHVSDVRRLVSVLERLVERGDTLVVIEHHPEVLASADWLIELGPEGGEGGGRIVAQGPPARIARGKTATAPFLRSRA